MNVDELKGLFRAFPKIERWKGASMVITQKLHGSNAQLLFIEDKDAPNGVLMMCGSRNRWLTLDDDNFGFASFCHANFEALYKALGPGRHYGEWCGPGINSGEGLEEKTFVLFDWKRYMGKELPNRVRLIPVLYDGKLDLTQIDAQLERLKTQGSAFIPGFMRPEGVVIETFGERFKIVFDPEETSWTKAEVKRTTPKPTPDEVLRLLQPIRMQKIYASDERFMREFPASLPDVVRNYVADLQAENQIDENSYQSIKKELSRMVFLLAKDVFNQREAA